jgi:hypothetical protein
MWEFHLGIQIFQVAVDENEGAFEAKIRAQKFSQRAVAKVGRRTETLKLSR